jgi:hypothetical protein
MPNSNGTPLGGIPRGGCWPEAGASVTLASAIHVVMEVTMSLLTKELARIDIIAEPDSEECIIAGQTGALKGTKSDTDRANNNALAEILSRFQTR